MDVPVRSTSFDLSNKIALILDFGSSGVVEFGITDYPLGPEKYQYDINRNIINVRR